MSYFHAKGIDRPLTITKYGKGTVVTHQNWRSQFARGTFQNGRHSDYEYVAPGTTPLHIPWPGWRTTAWHEDTQPRDVRHWWGELVEECATAADICTCATATTTRRRASSRSRIRLGLRVG
ncbi:MAG TPA: hypothetical protein VHG93_16840 [Longimicrobium sp.]|nr:hypothetical protein [Longimicrobium sp.]